jgi:hypothetical protein
MADSNGDRDHDSGGSVERVERGIRSAERFVILVVVFIVIIAIGWNIGGTNGEYVMIVGGALLAVLVMVEALLLERHRHRK